MIQTYPSKYGESPACQSSIEKAPEATEKDLPVSKAPQLDKFAALYRQYKLSNDRQGREKLRSQLMAAIKIEMEHVVRHMGYMEHFPNRNTDINDACQYFWEKQLGRGRTPVTVFETWKQDRGAALRTYFWRLLENSVTDHLRSQKLIARKQRSKAEPVSARPNGSARKPYAHEPSVLPKLVGGLSEEEFLQGRDRTIKTPIRPDGAIEQNERSKIVQDALSKLPRDYRPVALWMIGNVQRKEDGTFDFGSQTDGAKELGMAISTFNRYVAEVKKRMSTFLGQHRGDLRSND